MNTTFLNTSWNIILNSLSKNSLIIRFNKALNRPADEITVQKFYTLVENGNEIAGCWQHFNAVAGIFQQQNQLVGSDFLSSNIIFLDHFKDAFSHAHILCLRIYQYFFTHYFNQVSVATALNNSR